MHMAPGKQSKKSLLIPRGKPSATCAVCYMSLLTRSRWELLFKGRAFLGDRVQVGQIVLEKSRAPRGINTLIIPRGLRLAARVHERLGAERCRRTGETEQRQRIGRGFRSETGGDCEEGEGPGVWTAASKAVLT